MCAAPRFLLPLSDLRVPRLLSHVATILLSTFSGPSGSWICGRKRCGNRGDLSEGLSAVLLLFVP